MKTQTPTEIQIQTPMNKDQILRFLQEEDPQRIQELYRQAREAREQHFGNKIFLYGFVYFSTWCRQDCNFCYYRRSNQIERYRKTPAEILAVARELHASGVHLIDLTMGEDQTYHQEDFESVLALVRQIHAETGLPVMISPGVISDSLIQQFGQAGTAWYALYQETHNQELFQKLRIHQSYEERMHAKLYAKAQGMLIEEGILAGIGESLSDIADSILEMGRIGASQVRVMSFVPQKGIPLEQWQTPPRSLESKIIAILRLQYPDRLIPASLDVDGIQGLEERIQAGANVITSIIPPSSGFAGVAQSTMDVDEGGRTVQEAAQILATLGLVPATAMDYRRYLEQLRNITERSIKGTGV